ncbi:unnamed protein product, partial [marine sediment metagenome]
STGTCVTKWGIIDLYYQFKSEDFESEDYATARIIHNVAYQYVGLFFGQYIL